MGRFSDIKRGGQLNQKLTAYTAYLQNPPAPRLNSQGDRPASKQAFVTPFSLTTTANQVVAVNVSVLSYTKLSTIINGVDAQVADTATAANIIDVGRFRPARVSLFENATKTKTTPNSRYTGKPYLKYAGESFSCPFGKKAVANEMMTSFRAIRAALKARPNLAVNRVSLVPERIYQ